MKYGYALIVTCLVAPGCGDSRPASIIGPTMVTGTTAPVGAYTLSGTIRDLNGVPLAGVTLAIAQPNERRAPGGTLCRATGGGSVGERAAALASVIVRFPARFSDVPCRNPLRPTAQRRGENPGALDPTVRKTRGGPGPSASGPAIS
jgi:hypothetical protein